MAMPSFNTEQPMTELYFSSVTRDAVVRVDISKIVYFESDGNYTFIVTISSFKPSIGLNLVGVKRELLHQLGNQVDHFVRVGKRHIVNKNFICSINVLKQQLVLSDCDRFCYTLSISREALKKLKSDYFDHLNEELE